MRIITPLEQEFHQLTIRLELLAILAHDAQREAEKLGNGDVGDDVLRNIDDAVGRFMEAAVHYERVFAGARRLAEQFARSHSLSRIQEAIG